MKSAPKRNPVGIIPKNRKYYKIETLFQLYKECNRNIDGLHRYIKRHKITGVPQSPPTLRKYIYENGFDERLIQEEKQVMESVKAKNKLEKEKILMITTNGMMKYAKYLVEERGPRTAQEFEVLWKIQKIELGEPISITENTNINTEVITYIDSVTNGSDEAANVDESGEINEGIGILTAPHPPSS